MSREADAWNQASRVMELVTSIIEPAGVPLDIGTLAFMRLAAVGAAAMGMPPQIFMGSLAELYGKQAGLSMKVIVAGPMAPEQAESSDDPPN